jgi:hypothetical protein
MEVVVSPGNIAADMVKAGGNILRRHTVSMRVGFCHVIDHREKT